MRRATRDDQLIAELDDGGVGDGGVACEARRHDVLQVRVRVVDGTLVHISSRYDNEMGYSARCVDMIRHIGAQL